MLLYEWKKVFCKTGNRIALLILLAVLGVTCYFATGVSWVDENGDSRSGPGAVARLRAAQKAWAGCLDEDAVRRVIRENLRIESLPEAQTDNLRDSNITYGRKQGLMDIRQLLNYSFAAGFREYDYYRIDSLTPEDAPDFYANRTRLLCQWLEGEGRDQFTEAEKAFLTERYESLETPFWYDYSLGWGQVFEYAPTIMMITMLVLGYLGADGANLPVQIQSGGWKCFYHITVWQKYLLIAGGGYIGCLFVSFLCMLVSAETRSAVVAVLVPVVLLFLPSFLSNISGFTARKILGLLPDQLLQMGTTLNLFNLYSVGGKILGAVPVLLILYGLLTIVLWPVIYREYRHKQIG